MAVFNPSPNPTNDPSWLKFSKPISDVPADKTAGLALSTIGNALELGVGIADETIKKGIKDDVYASRDINHDVQVDRLETGVKAVTGDPTPTSVSGTVVPQNNPSLIPTAPVDKSEGAPPSLEQGLNQAGRLANASKNSPVVNDTFYSMQAESLAKKLRAQYPGYREYIDETISKAFGMPIANAYYKNLMQDLNHAVSQLNTQNKELTGLYDTNKRIPGNAARVAQLIQNPTAQGYFEYQNWVNRFEAADHRVKQASNAAALLAAQGKLSQEAAEEQSRTGAIAEADKMYTTSYLNSPEFNAAIEKGARGDLNPQEAPLMVQQIQAEKARTEKALQEYYRTPRPELDGMSYASKIGEDKVRANIKLANTRYDFALDVLAGDSKEAWGVLKLNKAYVDQLDVGAERELKTKFPVITRFQAAAKAIGPNAAGYVIQKELLGSTVTDNLKTYFQQATVAAVAPPSITTTDPATGKPKVVENDNSAATELENYRKSGIRPESQVYQGVFERIKLLDDPNIPLENKQNLLRSLFNPKNVGNLDKFRPDEPGKDYIQPGRHKAFDIVTSPDAIKSIEKATQNDYQLKAMYIDWVKKSWSDSILRSDVAAINTIDPKKFYFKWSDGSDGVSRVGFQLMDKETNKPVAPDWVYRQNPDPTKPAMAFVNVNGATYAASSLERLNRTLPNFTNVLQTFGDKRPLSVVMISTLNSVGASFGGQSEVGIIKGMQDAVTSSKVKPNDAVKSRFSNPGNVPETGAMQYTSEPRPRSLADWVMNPTGETPLNSVQVPNQPLNPAPPAPSEPAGNPIPDDIANNPNFDRYEPATGRTYMRNGMTQSEINQMVDARNRAKRQSQ